MSYEFSFATFPLTTGWEFSNQYSAAPLTTGWEFSNQYSAAPLTTGWELSDQYSAAPLTTDSQFSDESLRITRLTNAVNLMNKYAEIARSVKV